MRQWGRVAAGAGAGAGAVGWQPPAHLLPAHGLHHPLPRAAAQVPPNQESKAQTAPALGLAGQVQATVAFLSGSGQGAGAEVGVGTHTHRWAPFSSICNLPLSQRLSEPSPTSLRHVCPRPHRQEARAFPLATPSSPAWAAESLVTGFHKGGEAGPTDRRAPTPPTVCRLGSDRTSP